MHVKRYGSPLLLVGCTVCSITESVDAILKVTMKSNLLGSTHYCQVLLSMFFKVVLSSKPVDEIKRFATIQIEKLLYCNFKWCYLSL